MYHSDCYEKATGRKCARCATQYDGYCEYCRAFIKAGTTGINWRRRWQGQGNGKPLPEQPTITDAPVTEHAAPPPPAAPAVAFQPDELASVLSLLGDLETKVSTLSTMLGMLTSRVT